MAGSPFFVIKKNTQDKEIGEASIQETANSTFCFNSRVWKSALGSADVFYVTPEQVTKEANTGEYLTKGAFMIRGKTNYVSVRADLAIGVTKDKMIMIRITNEKLSFTHCILPKKYPPKTNNATHKMPPNTL